MTQQVRRIREVVQAPKQVRQIKQDRKRTITMKVPDSKVGKGTHEESLAKRNRRMRLEEEMFRACIAEGLSRENILSVMKLSDSSYAAIEKRVLANDGQRFLSKSTAHRYYEYCLQQEQCAKDLDYFVQAVHDAIQTWNQAIENLDKNDATMRKVIGAMPSPQSAILAIRAKSDILDRTIKMGQDMGIINKRAKEIRVSGQINLAALPTEKLRVLLEKKLSGMGKLVEEGSIPPAFRKMLKGKVEELEDVERSSEPESVMDATEFVETNSRSMG